MENDRLSAGTLLPPLLAISRCFSGLMEAKPRLNVFMLKFPLPHEEDLVQACFPARISHLDRETPPLGRQPLKKHVAVPEHHQAWLLLQCLPSD